MRALITGGNGFVGQWLAKALLERDDTVDLTGLGTAFGGSEILTPDEAGRVRWLAADIRDAAAIDVVVDASRPDVVFHLAGVSFPPDADRSPDTTYDVNTLGAVRLLSAIQRLRSTGVVDPITLIVGSGLQYGLHDESAMPLDESAEQRPGSPYAASKAAQEIASLQFFRGAGLRVICTRSFNHSGVGHAGHFLIPSLVARATRMARGKAHRFVIGNDVVRDYLHVGDVVAAYLALAERGAAGEVYNVATGRGVSARDLAGAILLHAGVVADISTDPSLVRAAEIPVLVGSPAKLMRDTGWVPRKTHADIIDDLFHATTD